MYSKQYYAENTKKNNIRMACSSDSIFLHGSIAQLCTAYNSYKLSVHLSVCHKPVLSGGKWTLGDFKFLLKPKF